MDWQQQSAIHYGNNYDCKRYRYLLWVAKSLSSKGYSNLLIAAVKSFQLSSIKYCIVKQNNDKKKVYVNVMAESDKNAHFFKTSLSSPFYTSVSNSIVVSENSNIWIRMFLFGT